MKLAFPILLQYITANVTYLVSIKCGILQLDAFCTSFWFVGFYYHAVDFGVLVSMLPGYLPCALWAILFFTFL